MMQKTNATPTPNTARSDLIKVIISVAIIEAPPRKRTPDEECSESKLLI